MLRRLLVRPRVVLPVLAWALGLGLLPHLAAGATLPPTSATASASDPAALETRQVVARLTALGVSREEATARVAVLTEAERHELAQRLDEVDAGGTPAAAVVAVAIIVGLLVVLILELMGRRVISRP